MDFQQRQALNIIRGLLPVLPINPRMNSDVGQLNVIVHTPGGGQGPNEFAYITRIGPHIWNVSLDVANMNCSDLECIINLLTRFGGFQRGMKWVVTMLSTLNGAEIIIN